MGPEDRAALLHVSGAGALCLAVVAAGALDQVAVEVGYGYYAEPPVPWLPPALAMPCNSLVNLGYVALGWRWFPRAGRGPRRYLQTVFALMALAYGPVQWARLWTQRPRAAVLDQWVTLPIFAWAGLWCHCLVQGWQPDRVALAMGASVLSYGLALAHARGFEGALAAHVAGVAGAAWRAQRRRGDVGSAWTAAVGFAACLGFVLLKLGDAWLAQWAPFRRLSGHFWSKVCDVLQFHCAFLFATRLGGAAPRPEPPLPTRPSPGPGQRPPPPPPSRIKRLAWTISARALLQGTLCWGAQGAGPGAD